MAEVRLPGFTEDDWARLGRAVYAARLRAGHTNTAEWAATLGVSVRWVLGLERGERVGGRMLERVERALEWPPDSAHSILRGQPQGQDSPAVSAAPSSEPVAATDLAAELVRLLGHPTAELQRAMTDEEVRDADGVIRAIQDMANARAHATALITARLVRLTAELTALIDGDTSQARRIPTAAPNAPEVR